MIVDRLIVHHTYRGSTVFDLSGNRNHGIPEGAVTVFGDGRADFAGDEDCIRIPASESLSGLRAVRVAVTFQWTPPALQFPSRFNLAEGYLSFALFIERVGESSRGKLVGSVLDRTGAWHTISSAENALTPRRWHTVEFVHDGISSARLDLDGVTVAQGFDLPGPVQGIQNPYGLAIGRWPDPEPRYTFVGAISEFQLWKDRPEALREVVDQCCCENTAAADTAFARLRESDPDLRGHVAAAEELYDIGSRAFGLMASGSETTREHAYSLARRVALAIGTRDPRALQDAIISAATLSQAQIPTAERGELTNRMVNALRPTTIGPLLDALVHGEHSSAADLQQVLADTGLTTWLNGFCLDWVLHPPQTGEAEPSAPAPQPGRGSDPDTDHDPDTPPPHWYSAGPAHENPPVRGHRARPKKK